MKSLVSAIRAARTPAQTTTPVPYVGRAYGSGFSGLMRPAGQEAELKSLGANGTLFAIVNKYAATTAAATWHLNRQATGRNTEPVEVTSHAALDLWNKPTTNAHYTRTRLVKAFQQHKELVGEGILVVVKVGSLPIELWPVRPDRMEPVPHPQRYLAGWIYHGPDGERVPLLPDQVIQMQQAPCPWDPYHGMGAVQTILTDLYSASAAAEWNRQFFINSAEPGGVVEVDRRLSDDEFNEMTARWREQHQGVNNAHRVAILEQVKWVQNAFSPRDMQFVELRGASSEMIRQAFAFPKTMLGDIEDVNRASAEAETYIFASGHTVPRLSDIRDELNARLLPMYGPTGRGLEFAYDSPVPEDREADDRERTSKATAVATLAAAGYDPAAVLDWAGLPPMDYTAPAAPGAGLPGRSLPGPKTPSEVDGARRPLALPAHNGHRHPHPPALPPARNADDEDDPEPDLSGVRDDLDEALDRFEQQFAPILARQIDALVEQVETAIDDDDLDALTDLAVPDDLTGADLLRRALGDLAATAAQRAARECAAQGVDVVAPDVDEDLTDLGLPDIVAFGAELVEIARVTAELAAAGLAGSAAREALRHYTPGAVGSRVAGKVRDRLEALKGSDRAAQVGAAMHRATNLARGAAFAAALKLRRGGKIYASEQNDPNACEPCRDWDGHEFATLAEAREMYDAGGYPDCLGRERCRGTYFIRWKKG
ncbi:phage portal protein [Frankia sp. Mgl5]|uniref:phage portal protein n=1 Tax=Frankia sp. Mgl5 TaxID=2933793 RepID=UPI00200CB41D|nr:phage portal protein [Frankia sp. Mgl5]MCK9929441.1 phage portal protein [Frankia sp. Mgl5]